MAVFVDPDATFEQIFDGVVFTCRPLSARELAKVVKESQGEGAEAAILAFQFGVVGVSAAPFTLEFTPAKGKGRPHLSDAMIGRFTLAVPHAVACTRAAPIAQHVRRSSPDGRRITRPVRIVAHGKGLLPGPSLRLPREDEPCREMRK
jgi:hypothetical protein